jgi:hypothetical protein
MTEGRTVVGAPGSRGEFTWPGGARPVPSGAVRSLRSRQFALLFVGYAVNAIGTWATLVAMWGFAAYKFHSGPAGIALIALTWSLPRAAIGPFAGIPIDRLSPKRA